MKKKAKIGAMALFILAGLIILVETTLFIKCQLEEYSEIQRCEY